MTNGIILLNKVTKQFYLIIENNLFLKLIFANISIDDFLNVSLF